MVANNAVQANGGRLPDDGPSSAQPESSTRPDDPRLALLKKWLEAVDKNESRSAVEFARELRRLGVSVVAVTPKGEGGGR